MSVISSINLIGTYKNQSLGRFGAVINFLKNCEAEIQQGNEIEVTQNCSGDTEYASLTVSKNDPFNYLIDCFVKGKINGIFATLQISGQKQYFLFSPISEKELEIAISGHRKVIDKYKTDFSWYSKNFITIINQELFSVESVNYQDIY